MSAVSSLLNHSRPPPTFPSCNDRWPDVPTAYLPLPRSHQCPQCHRTCQSVSNRLRLFLASVISSTQKMKATRSSETSVYNKPKRSHIQEDGTLYLYLPSQSNNAGANWNSRYVGFEVPMPVGHNAVWSAESRHTFRRNIPPPSSGSNKISKMEAMFLANVGDVQRAAWRYTPRRQYSLQFSMSNCLHLLATGYKHCFNHSYGDSGRYCFRPVEISSLPCSTSFFLHHDIWFGGKKVEQAARNSTIGQYWKMAQKP
jgi:hypothetical protein